MTDHKRVSSPIPENYSYAVSLHGTVVCDKTIDKNISLALSINDFVDYKCGVIYNAAYFGDNGLE